MKQSVFYLAVCLGLWIPLPGEGQTVATTVILEESGERTSESLIASAVNEPFPYASQMDHWRGAGVRDAAIVQLEELGECRRGRLSLLRGDAKQAERLFDQALERTPHKPEAYFGRALARVRLQRFQTAAADFRTFLELSRPAEQRDPFSETDGGTSLHGSSSDRILVHREDPALAPAYANLAWIYASFPESPLYDPKRAIQLAERACRLTDEEHPAALETLAAAYAGAGRFEDAARWQRRALQVHLELRNQGPPARQGAVVKTVDLSRYARRLDCYRKGRLPDFHPIHRAVPTELRFHVVDDDD